MTALEDYRIELIDVPSVKVARLPLWPTKAHLDGLVRAGKLDIGNIFVGEAAWKNAKINAEAPQVFGYTIANDEELARVITDAKTLEDARKEVTVSGTFPTVYFPNHEARLAYAAYLGGRVPSQEEQKDFWNKLPGATALEKTIGAGIPFVGYFDSGYREALDVGDWTCLVSSSKNSNGFPESLYLNRNSREVHENWNPREHGFSCLVMFG